MRSPARAIRLAKSHEGGRAAVADNCGEAGLDQRVTSGFYDGARHELMNETNRAEVTSGI